jgi:hypothetical protein
MHISKDVSNTDTNPIMPRMPSGYEGAFSIAEFCKRYGIGRSKAYDEIRQRKLSIRKVGTRSLILLCDAERWAASLPEATL